MRGLLLVLPAVISVGLLRTPIPQGAYAGREIAGYFQTLALVRDGLSSYTYFTPEESLTALHLHSLLSIPLLELGWTEGGRLISLAATVGSALLLVAITRRVTGDASLSILAGALFWCHPWILSVATAYTPDTLGIFLTTGAIYAVIRHRERPSAVWFGLACLLTILGISNHLWEIVIIVPAVALLLEDGKRRDSALYVLVSIVAAVSVVLITEIQSAGSTSHSGFSIISAPLAPLSAEFWFGHISSPHPVNVDVTVTLWLGVIGAAYSGYEYLSGREWQSLLTFTWLSAGLSVPFLLPVGYIAHMYYTWCLFAPLSLLAVQILRDVRLANVLDVDRLTVGAIALAILYLFVFEYAILAGAGVPLLDQATEPAVEQQSGIPVEETLSAGDALSARVEDPSRVTFDGDDWSIMSSEDGTVRYGNALAASQSLVYSDLLPKGRRFNEARSPRIGEADNCNVKVQRVKSEILVADCP